MISAIYGSFRALPLWVQIWVFVLLVPVNMASLMFLGQPIGILIAVLANGAMMLNGVIMLYERGFSKAMALPHVVIWVPLVVLIGVMLASGRVDQPSFVLYLKLLLVIDLISLGFDFKDAWDWKKGARQVMR